MQSINNKKIFVNELIEGQKISSYFLAKNKEIRLKRDGDKFLSVELADKTGSIPGVIWENVESLTRLFEKDNIVDIEGLVQSYASKPQINISKISQRQNDYEISHFLPVYQGDISLLKAELHEIISSIKDDHYKKLIDLIFTEEFIKKLGQAPAAVNLHHSYLGGLLEHIVSVARLAKLVGSLYKLNRDLLLTATLLHDIGKIEELSVGNSISYSDEGRLLGHLAIADHFVASAIEKIKDFPKEKALQLRHALISHHGELEWGSPKRPKTIEALVLHHIDNLDAKISMFRETVAMLDGTEGWTDSRNPFRRSLYNKNNNKLPIQETIEGI